LPLDRRSGPVEAGGSLIWGTPGKVASGPDNDGTDWYCQTVRVRQARPEGVTKVNQWLKSRKRGAGSNLVDRGRCAVRDLHPVGMGSTPKPVNCAGGEATVTICGVSVARLPGQSWVPTWSIDFLVNVGTMSGRPLCRPARSGMGRFVANCGPGMGRRSRSSPST
jgi:hypothetical protein